MELVPDYQVEVPLHAAVNSARDQLFIDGPSPMLSPDHRVLALDFLRNVAASLLPVHVDTVFSIGNLSLGTHDASRPPVFSTFKDGADRTQVKSQQRLKCEEGASSPLLCSSSLV